MEQVASVHRWPGQIAPDRLKQHFVPAASDRMAGLSVDRRSGEDPEPIVLVYFLSGSG